MFIFSLRPASYPYNYLSAYYHDFRSYDLTVNSDNNQETIAFITSQSILNGEVTGSPAPLYCIPQSGFLDFWINSRVPGENDAILFNTITPVTTSKLYIKMIDMSRCYIYLNDNSNDPFIDYTNTYVLSYDLKRDYVYFSNSPLYPENKIWFIDIYTQKNNTENNNS